MGRAEGAGSSIASVSLHPWPCRCTAVPLKLQGDTRRSWGGQLPMSGHSGFITKRTFTATQERETLGRF